MGRGKESVRTNFVWRESLVHDCRPRLSGAANIRALSDDDSLLSLGIPAEFVFYADMIRQVQSEAKLLRGQRAGAQADTELFEQAIQKER